MRSEQLRNLKNLREVGRRILRERLPLGFGNIRSKCGTFACLVGWYGEECGIDGSQDIIDACWYGAPKHFGIAKQEADKLFYAVVDLNDEFDAGLDESADFPGPAAYTELERRLSYLDTLIAKHEPKGMPDSVRRIFETEVACGVEKSDGPAEVSREAALAEVEHQQ